MLPSAAARRQDNYHEQQAPFQPFPLAAAAKGRRAAKVWLQESAFSSVRGATAEPDDKCFHPAAAPLSQSLSVGPESCTHQL